MPRNWSVGSSPQHGSPVVHTRPTKEQRAQDSLLRSIPNKSVRRRSGKIFNGRAQAASRPRNAGHRRRRPGHQGPRCHPQCRSRSGKNTTRGRSTPMTRCSCGWLITSPESVNAWNGAGSRQSASGCHRREDDSSGVDRPRVVSIALPMGNPTQRRQYWTCGLSRRATLPASATARCWASAHSLHDQAPPS